MSSIHHIDRAGVADALDTMDAAQARLLALPLHTLTTAELLDVLERLEGADRRAAALQRRVLGRLTAATLSARRPGGSLSGTLSRRLRISDTEARHRIADALRPAS